MSNQPRQPVTRADPPQEPGAIQRMKSRLRQIRGIPDVMKPRRRRQQLIRQAKPGSNLLATSTSTLDMPPPTRQHRIQIPLRQNTRLSCRHHDPERTTQNIRPCTRPSALHCRIMPFLDQGGACGAAGSASAPGSASERPARRTPGQHAQDTLISLTHTSTQPGTGPSSWLTIVRLAVTASRAALRAVACDRLRRPQTPATTHLGLAPARKTGRLGGCGSACLARLDVCGG